jgi:hypothetical protein
MHVDTLAVHLRPRLMSEAADLGVRLVQAHAGSVLRCYVPVYGVVAVLALATVELAGWLPGLIVFWLKPWLDRTLMFVLSRAVFGEATRPADLWRAAGPVWWGQLLSTLTLRRLSPWRAYTQAVVQLEGQRGADRRARRRQILNGKQGAALGLQFAFSQVELALTAALLMLGYWFTPPDARWQVLQWFNEGSGVLGPLLLSAPYVLVVGLVEPFYLGAGFAMYLNRRVELEAWDVEQEMRRVFAG